MTEVADTEAKVAGERWAALEANPEVMTKLCHQLGVSAMFEVVDVWGLEPDLLGFVPQPVIALILLFPSKGQGQERHAPVADHPLANNVYYLTQLKGHLDNACGTIAMIHSVLNNRDMLGVSDNAESVGEKFYQATINSDKDERGKCLDTYDDIVNIHNQLVTQGQSGVVESEKVSHHFLSLTAVDGHLVELDGAYNSGPNIIEKIPEDAGFLNTAAKFVKEKYISAQGADGQLALMALTAKMD